jgi:hypothetical protein
MNECSVCYSMKQDFEEEKKNYPKCSSCDDVMCGDHIDTCSACYVEICYDCRCLCEVCGEHICQYCSLCVIEGVCDNCVKESENK